MAPTYEYSKTIVSGSLVEVYRFERAPRPPISKGNKRIRKPSDSGGDSKPVKRRPDSIRRLRRGFLRLVRANLDGKGAPSFATFTFAANVAYAPAIKCFTEFVILLRKNLVPGVSYIAVPEFQKRGAVHFHVLFWGIPDSIVLNERSTRLLQVIWARGFVDIIPTDGSDKLAGYLAKYMQKALHDERLVGRKSYHASRGLMRPVLHKTSLVTHYPKEILGGDIELLTERTYSTQWLGQGNYKVYKLIEDHGTNDIQGASSRGKEG